MKTKSRARPCKEKKRPHKTWDLKLYVLDHTLKSVTALSNLKRICREELENRCRISVIDIQRHPQLAKENQIVAVPTLVKTSPLPARTVIGDLSKTDLVFRALQLHHV